MNEVDVGRFYDGRVERYGMDVRAVGWPSTKQQELRFQILLEGFPKEIPFSIIDVGCGFGDLYRFIRNSGWNPRFYLGLDLSPKMIQAANEAFARTGVQFKTKDFNHFTSETLKFDLVVMSGSLNLKTDSSPAERTFRFFQNSWQGLESTGQVRANFLSTEVDFRQSHHQHYELEETVKVASLLFDEVTYVDNYGLKEFTILARSPKSDVNIDFNSNY